MKNLLLALVALSVTSLVGCADDDSSFVDTCIDHCEFVGGAANCPASVANQDLDECKASCQPYASMISGECRDALEAFDLCSMSFYTYECRDGNDLPSMEFEGDEVDPCQEESDAYIDACVLPNM